MHTYTLLARPHRAFQSQCYNDNLKKNTNTQTENAKNKKNNKLKETSSGSHLSLRLKPVTDSLSLSAGCNSFHNGAWLAQS